MSAKHNPNIKELVDRELGIIEKLSDNKAKVLNAFLHSQDSSVFSVYTDIGRLDITSDEFSKVNDDSNIFDIKYNFDQFLAANNTFKDDLKQCIITKIEKYQSYEEKQHLYVKRWMLNHAALCFGRSLYLQMLTQCKDIASVMANAFGIKYNFSNSDTCIYNLRRLIVLKVCIVCNNMSNYHRCHGSRHVILRFFELLETLIYVCCVLFLCMSNR